MGLVDLQESGPGQTATEPVVDLLENGRGQNATEIAHRERSSADLPTVKHGPLLLHPIADLDTSILCSSRSCRPPAHLDDYVCYNTCSQDPLSLANRLQK